MALVSLGEKDPPAPTAEVLILPGSSTLPLGKDAPSEHWLGFWDPYSEAFIFACIRACQRVHGECGVHRRNKSGVLTAEAQYPSLHPWSKQGPRCSIDITDCS